MKLEFSEQIFENSWNVKFHENPSSESYVVPHRQIDKDGWTDRQAGRHTDITKLLVTFPNFADVPNNNLSRDCS